MTLNAVIWETLFKKKPDSAISKLVCLGTEKAAEVFAQLSQANQALFAEELVAQGHDDFLFDVGEHVEKNIDSSTKSKTLKTPAAGHPNVKRRSPHPIDHTVNIGCSSDRASTVAKQFEEKVEIAPASAKNPAVDAQLKVRICFTASTLESSSQLQGVYSNLFWSEFFNMLTPIRF